MTLTSAAGRGVKYILLNDAAAVTFSAGASV